MHFFSRVKYLIWAIIALFALLFIFSWSHLYTAEELEYGATFSDKQARDLGLDWKQVYLAMLDDLQVKKLRLPAYWDEIETVLGSYNWENLDWQIDEAEKRNVELIVVVGQRQPRWPECHLPQWTNNFSAPDRQKAIMEYIDQTVSRYKNRPTLRFWQVENEPFLKYFGTCPEFDKNFLDQEIKEVKNLDTRPIIVTDSGELSLWAPAAKRADIFGSTLYRDTFSRTVHSYIHYPIGPVFFRIKKNIANLFASPQDWIIIELQGEPWGKEAFQNLSQAERNKTMTPSKFKDMVTFIQKTGFKTFYWWGVEYWYWEKTKMNNPFYWETAKQLYNGSYGK
jgi:hypothetical protein